MNLMDIYQMKSVVNYKQNTKLHFLLIRICTCLLGFVCRAISLQSFTEISRFLYISLQIFSVLRLRGLKLENILEVTII